MPSATDYSRSAIALHWAIALLVFALFPLGIYMVDLPLSPQKLKLYSWHKWAGFTVFLLAVLRAAWRATHAAPPPPETMSAWQKRAANVTHALLYVLLFAAPLSGWLMSSAKGFQTVYLGLIPLPDLVGKDEALGEALAWLHRLLVFTLGALVITHATAALKHHLVDRDDVLARMLPFLASKKEAGRCDGG